MVRRATRLHPRIHKGMKFYPTGRTGTKRELKRFLVEKRTDIPTRVDEYGNVTAYDTNARVADRYYYRIYPHKGNRWSLYLGDFKYSHGGLITRGKTGLIRSPKTKTTNTTPKTKTEKPTQTEKNSVERFLENYEEIDSGLHQGYFKDKRTGEIYSPTQIRVKIANGEAREME